MIYLGIFIGISSYLVGAVSMFSHRRDTGETMVKSIVCSIIWFFIVGAVMAVEYEEKCERNK